jgi:hypothetical protein
MLPAPFSVQAIVPLLEVAPLTVAVPFWQIAWLPPAVAVGGSFIMKFLLDVAFEQPVFPVAVKVSVLLPAAISAGLGS